MMQLPNPDFKSCVHLLSERLQVGASCSEACTRMHGCAWTVRAQSERTRQLAGDVPLVICYTLGIQGCPFAMLHV
eukprot:364653-Chlamydomonas_euryale.AAC.4